MMDERYDERYTNGRGPGNEADTVPRLRRLGNCL